MCLMEEEDRNTQMGGLVNVFTSNKLPRRPIFCVWYRSSQYFPECPEFGSEDMVVQELFSLFESLQNKSDFMYMYTSVEFRTD